jgi:hypothetical protein
MAGLTILLSVLLHGFSALPLADWYARRLETTSLEAPELIEISELRTKRRTPFNLHMHHPER